MSESQPLLVQDNESTTEENNSEGRTLRDKAIKLLESNTFHTFVIALIAIDASCVIADLIYTLLPQNCTPDQPMGDAPAWLEVLSHVSLTITTLFLLEIPLAVWAFGPHYYNPSGTVPHASLHLFDAFIILATFTLEAVLKGKERELAGLLIVFRLWRIVKLVGGTVYELARDHWFIIYTQGLRSVQENWKKRMQRSSRKFEGSLRKQGLHWPLCEMRTKLSGDG
ncbi:hypothetical protein JOM56_003623 [Amanita muscaria]